MAKILSSAILIFLLWATAVVVLGGVANLQKQCEDSFNAPAARLLMEDTQTEPGAQFGGRKLAGARELLMTARTSCGTQYSLAWWIIALQVLCNLLAVAAAFSTSIRFNFGNSIVHMFTAVTVLLMYIASTLYPMYKLQLTSGTKLYKTVEATLAGVMATAAVDFIYIWFAASVSHRPTLTTADGPESTDANNTPRYERDMKVTINA